MAKPPIQIRGNRSVVVVVDDQAVANLANRGGPVDRWTLGKTRMVASFARRFAPVRTGRLRASIKVEQSRDTAGRYKTGYSVSANTPYAAFVHEGTRPHVIVPVTASVLRFEVGGSVVFARRVNHPGNRANPFLSRALAAGMAGSR